MAHEASLSAGGTRQLRDPEFDSPVERFLQHRDWHTDDGREVLRRLPWKLRRRALWLLGSGAGSKYRWQDGGAELEDAVQHTVGKVYKYVREHEGTTAVSFKAWAYRILERDLLDFAERARKCSSRRYWPEPRSCKVHNAIDVHRILEQLRRDHPRYARVLELAELEGLSSREGAEVLGITVDNFDQTKQRARAKFREYYSRGVDCTC